MPRLQGLYTALITPFDANGQLDEAGLRQNVEFQIENGVDGLVVCGTTGEDPTLTYQERERVLKSVVDQADGRVPVVMGTGSFSTQTTIETTQKAEKWGASMALVVSPYYNKPTQEGLYQHFKAVAKAVSIPVIVYNIFGRTGVNIQTDTLKRLADIPNIIGVKEASGSISQVGEVIENISRTHPRFSVLSGDDNMTFPLMALGGHGVISVASNLIPKEVKAMIQALLDGEYAEARERHYTLMPLFRSMFLETNPMCIKTAMNGWGYPAGPCRLPLCEMLPEMQRKLENILEPYRSQLIATHG